MRLSNGEVLMTWPLSKHLLTVGWYYRNTKNGTYTVPHRAIDLSCSWDGKIIKPVYAAESGTVVWTQNWDGKTTSGNSIQTYGNAVLIEHKLDYKGKPLQTRYAHLSSFIVHNGQNVSEGEVIGYTGNTGAVQGAHLHFEVYYNGHRVNPLCWLDDDFEPAPGFIPYTYNPGEHAVERLDTHTRNLIRTLDISYHQRDIDAEKMRQNGIQHVFCRAGYAASVDSRFDSYVKQLKEAGIKVSAYHFGTWHYAENIHGSITMATMMLEGQMSSFIESLNRNKITGWVAIDQELERYTDENGNKVPYTMGLSAEVNTTMLNMAADMLTAAGYSPCLYASASWLMTYVKMDRLKMPVWVAYYYNDPNDPDFSNCRDVDNLAGRYGSFMQSLGDKLIGWQFGRIEYGHKYGVTSANVDRDFFYKMPEERKIHMNFKEVENINILVTTTGKPACEVFSEPDTAAKYVIGSLPYGQLLTAIAVGDTVKMGNMAGTWIKVKYNAAPNGFAYILNLPDRSKLIEVGEENPEVTPEEPPEKAGPIDIYGDGTLSDLLRAVADWLDRKGE